MNVNAVNLYTGTGAVGASRYAGSAKYVPSDKERQEKLSKIEERANGGVSKDGDTVNISSEGSSLQKMFEAKGKNQVDFLKEDAGKAGSAADAVSKNAEELGITKELNEKQLRSGEVNMLNKGLESAKDLAAETREKDVSDLSQFTNHELLEKFENGDITTKAYKAEMESRSTNRSGNADDKTPVSEDTAAPEDNRANALNANDKEDISVFSLKNNDAEERLNKIQTEDRQQARTEENKRLNEAVTEKAQELRAEKTENRLETEKENLQAARQADNEQYNAEFSFQGTPYDVTSSIKEMEEDDSEIGINRIEAPENNTPERVVAKNAAPKAEEETEELQDIRSTVNSDNVENVTDTRNAEEAGNAATLASIDQTASDNRLTVQEVA